MPRAGHWRSEVGLALHQRRAKRSFDGVGLPATAIGVGAKGVHDGGLILAGVLNPGVIAGGAQAAASIASGGNGARQALLGSRAGPGDKAR
jgi:hypothetical protein